MRADAQLPDAQKRSNLNPLSGEIHAVNEQSSRGRTISDYSVCAIVVTYFPSPDMIESLAEIHAQVQELVVIDNGSGPNEANGLRMAAQTSGFHLIANTENFGIAGALNQGIRWAQGAKFPWVILFDQDSKIADRFIPEMFTAWEMHAHRDRVGAIHPRYIDPMSRIEFRMPKADDSGPIVSMTSGALMPLWIFEKIGLFETEYFIDWVDFEYSFRIRAAGYTIVESRSAALFHSAGHPREVSLLGYRIRPSHHNPTRQYYISRNRLVVFRKYFRTFPLWVLRVVFSSFRETIKSILVEENRIRKLRNCLLGTWDALVGRMGKREGI